MKLSTLGLSGPKYDTSWPAKSTRHRSSWLSDAACTIFHRDFSAIKSGVGGLSGSARGRSVIFCRISVMYSSRVDGDRRLTSSPKASK